MKKILNAIQNFLKNLPHLFYFVIFIIYLTVNYYSASNENIKWSEPELKELIKSYASGYYAYLPQVLLYKSNNFEFTHKVAQETNNPKISVCSIDPDDNSKIYCFNKYFVGTAICMSPFYLAADFYVQGNDKFERTGYSFPYEVAISISTFFYLCVGFLFLHLLLKTFNFSTFSIIIGLCGLAFGTNLKYYTLFEPALSHVYSFSVIAAFLYLTRKYFLTRKNSYLLLLFFTLGLISIIRPTNFMIVLLVPFMAANWSDFKTSLLALFSRPKITFTVLSFLLFLLPIFIQFLNIYNQYGVWKFNGYSSETFDNWLSPEIFNVLFSYRKGLFVYTPFLILCMLGLITLYKKNRYFFLGWSIFFVIFTYVTASWWNWYYGGSLGMRPFIDIYAVLIIPFVALFHYSNLLIKTVLLLTIPLLAIHNDTQNTQVLKGIYHMFEMDEDKFKRVFLRTDRRFEWLPSYYTAIDKIDTSIEKKSLQFNPYTITWDSTTSKKIATASFIPYIVAIDPSYFKVSPLQVNENQTNFNIPKLYISDTSYFKGFNVQLKGEGNILDRELAIGNLKIHSYKDGQEQFIVEYPFLYQLDNSGWSKFTVQKPIDFPMVNIDSFSIEIIHDFRNVLAMRDLRMNLYK